LIANGLSPEDVLRIFGHLADGTVHAQLQLAEELHRQITIQILEAVDGVEGSPSSEHGLGCMSEKFAYADEVQRTLLEMISSTLDPDQLANPGVAVL
jgi:FAD/FMN-containing dehydrogenase